MPIEIKLTAENSEELRTLLKGVAYLLSGQVTSTVQSIHEPAAVMTVDPEAEAQPEPVELVDAKPKRGRGRPPKVQAEPEPEVVVPEEVPVVDNSEVAEAMPAQDEPRSDSEVFRNAMVLLKTIFDQDPKGSEKIKSIQKKYGVLKLGDIPVSRAGELWKDADQLANGEAA